MAGQGSDDTDEHNDVVRFSRALGGAGDCKKWRFNATPSERTLRDPPQAPPPAAALFPDEIIAEILSLVPVKSLLRFKCVCKSWKTLITDPQFVKTHLQRSIMDSNFTHHRLMPKGFFVGENIVSCSVRSLFNNPLTVPENLSCPLEFDLDIVGSCNGLLCLVGDENFGSKRRVLLWNPSTRLCSKRLYLPLNLHGRSFEDDADATVFGFGYDELNDIYKVVAVLSKDEFAEHSVQVYSLGTDSWREVQSFPAVPDCWRGSGLFVSGAINWLASHQVGAVVSLDTVFTMQYMIVSFDLETETSRELLLPGDFGKNCFVTAALSVLRDCLCVCQDYKVTRFVLWQMMEYGVKESWIKLLNISYLDLDTRAYGYLEPLCMSEKGDIMVTTHIADGKVILYNLTDNRSKCHGIQSNKRLTWFHSMLYIESLVSPFC